MKIQSSIRNINLRTKKSNSRKNQSTSSINKTGLTEEMIENCRANLANYYVCYGSAVVSVRNAECRIIHSIDSITLFYLDECKSQDIIIDMATWLLLDSDSVKSKNFN
jgi:hypothetical protein